jgi:hypothetical protein
MLLVYAACTLQRSPGSSPSFFLSSVFPRLKCLPPSVAHLLPCRLYSGSHCISQVHSRKVTLASGGERGQWVLASTSLLIFKYSSCHNSIKPKLGMFSRFPYTQQLDIPLWADFQSRCESSFREHCGWMQKVSFVVSSPEETGCWSSPGPRFSSVDVCLSLSFVFCSSLSVFCLTAGVRPLGLTLSRIRLVSPSSCCVVAALH